MEVKKPQEIGDVMHMVAEHIDHRQDQKVTIFRNGPHYTVFLTETGRASDNRHARVILPQEAAMKLYLKLVRAMVTEKYSWEIRSGWVTKAEEAKTA